MNPRLHRSVLLAATLAMNLSLPAAAQWDKKPYAEWSEKESTKILNDSPWGQTQVFTDTSGMFDRGRRADSSESRIAEELQVNFRIRFFSAKPIRQAIARAMEFQHGEKLPEQTAQQLKQLADADFPDYIIMTVLVDAPRTSGYMQTANSLLYRLTTSELKNRTYLLTKGGDRVFLHEYQSPRRDGLGARFIFPRVVDGKPFIPDSGDVLFFSELNATFTLRARFKIKEMMYAGKIEY